MNKITVLTPKDSEAKIHAVPSSTTEQPGMGAAMGGVVGAAAGMAGGFGLGEVAVTAAIPVIGPVIALGLLGAVVLGWIGAEVGEKIDEAKTDGLLADELFVYEDALRKGRSVVIALVDDDEAASSARRVMEEERAESIDAARKQWWMGLRSGEKEHYSTPEKDLDRDEMFYRQGFEALSTPTTAASSTVRFRAKWEMTSKSWSGAIRRTKWKILSAEVSSAVAHITKLLINWLPQRGLSQQFCWRVPVLQLQRKPN